nr:hypothetical protein Iba_chr09bCG6270 [Ipomoea batatas]
MFIFAGTFYKLKQPPSKSGMQSLLSGSGNLTCQPISCQWVLCV